MKIKVGDKYGRLTVTQAPSQVIKMKSQRLSNGGLRSYRTSMTEVKCDCGRVFMAYTNNLQRMAECIQCKRKNHAETVKNSWAKNKNLLVVRIRSRERDIEDIEERIYQWTIKAERLENEKAGFEKLLEGVLND